MKVLSILSAVSAVLAQAAAVSGQFPAISYELLHDSQSEIGCQGPCACPILILSPLTGTFDLTRTGSDGLFDYYDVGHVDWRVPQANPPLHLTGSGRYRIGGEVARQHQLTLDLVDDALNPHRFDSGLVAGGKSFPAIEIDVAVHDFFCYDTVLTVHAVPPTAAAPREPGDLQIIRASPNPFRDRLQMEFAIGESTGPVRVSVFDVLGREVRRLVPDVLLSPGLHRVDWDGRTDFGRDVPAGLYILKLSRNGRSEARSLVRIQ